MSTAWPLVPLGEVLIKSEDWVTVEPEKQYNEVTVRLWGKGVVLRRQVTGAEIASGRRLRVRANQFILSRIDARNGATGLIPESLDGAIVSNDFPVFGVNDQRVCPSFLGWVSRTTTFVDLCKKASEGTTNRVRLQEERFLSTQIPLPPLSEQRLIVARIEELAAKIDEARGQRVLGIKGVYALSASSNRSAFEAVSGATSVSVEEVSSVVTKGTTPKTYGHMLASSGIPFLRAEEVLEGYLNWKGTPFFLSQDTNRFMERSQTKAGDVLITIAGTIGRSAVVPPETPQLNMNQAIALVRPIGEVDPSYLCKFVNSPYGQEQLRQATVTTAISNISLSTIRSMRLPLPSLAEQRRIVAYLDDLQAKVYELKRLQAETTAELDALLPSILDKAFKGDLLRMPAHS